MAVPVGEARAAGPLLRAIHDLHDEHVHPFAKGDIGHVLVLVPRAEVERVEDLLPVQVDFTEVIRADPELDVFLLLRGKNIGNSIGDRILNRLTQEAVDIEEVLL